MKTIVLIVLWFIPSLSIAKSTIDNSSDSVRAYKASDLAWELKDINPDSSFYYAKIALRYSRKSGEKKAEAYSLSDIGNYYKRQEQYEEALDYYLKSLSTRKQIGDNELIAGGYNQIALLHKQKEDFKTAAHYFRQGLSYTGSTENKTSKQRLKLLNGYCMTLYHLGLHEESLLQTDSAFRLAQAIGDSLSLAKLLQNRGAIYQYLGQRQLALQSYQRAANYYNDLGDISGIIDITINLASVYLQEGDLSNVERLLLDAENKSVKHQLISNLPIIYFDLAKLYQYRNTDKSKFYFNLVYENAKKTGKTTLIVESGIELCRIELFQKPSEKLSKILEELEKYIAEITDLEILIDYYDVTSSYWKKLGNFKKAFALNDKALTLRDSLYTHLSKQQDLSALLEVSRQEEKTVKEELKRRNAEKQHSELQSTFQKVINWALIIVVIILLVFLFLARKGAKRKAQLNDLELEKMQQQQEFQNQISELVFHADLKFLEESLLLEEEIRKNIGKDLHDHLASKLAVIQIRLDALADMKMPNSNIHEELIRIIDLVEESCNDTRIIAHDLIAQKRLNETLSESLQNHCKMVSESGKLRIDYATIGDVIDIDMTIKKNVLATVILLIDNIIRHANATSASLQLFYHADSLNLVLDDNGIGFDQKHVEGISGVGLINAKERIMEIKGEIDFATQIDKGTTISISIPIEHETL